MFLGRSCYSIGPAKAASLGDRNRGKRVSLSRSKERSLVPKDVPKGHLAVYVGEEGKRFVINIAMLNNPSFRALLDHVEEVFQFSEGSRLRIPCEERVFESVLRSVGPERGPRFWHCL